MHHNVQERGAQCVSRARGYRNFWCRIRRRFVKFWRGRHARVREIPMMQHQSLGGPGPTDLEKELADLEALQKIREVYKWDENHKEYQKRLKALQKKWKGEINKGNMHGNMPSAKKQQFLWAEWGKKDAGDFKEAVSFLPDIFGPGKYGTSGVNSRGGKQNYKDEWCAWKRFARDGRHFRVLEHTTGYYYQEGFFPSHNEDDEEEEDKEGANEGDDDKHDEEKEEGEEEEEEAAKPQAKKQKGGKGAAVPAEAPKARAKAPKAAKEAPKASPERASKRARK